jgi:hypothetical protein
LHKLKRGHERDLLDVRSLLRAGLVQQEHLRELFGLIEPLLIRYPALDPAPFRDAWDKGLSKWPNKTNGFGHFPLSRAVRFPRLTACPKPAIQQGQRPPFSL